MQVKRSRGTASRRANNETAGRIVLAARELLMDEGYAQFSMRNVAARAGVHLANVQYYFKTREDLVVARIRKIPAVGDPRLRMMGGIAEDLAPAGHGLPEKRKQRLAAFFG